MNQQIECYVLFCIADETYLTPMSFWHGDIMKAIKYKDISRAKEEQSHYGNTVKVMKVSIDINGTILD